jgi:hypothetical protein
VLTVPPNVRGAAASTATLSLIHLLRRSWGPREPRRGADAGPIITVL